jgi:hypothetical protein
MEGGTGKVLELSRIRHLRQVYENCKALMYTLRSRLLQGAFLCSLAIIRPVVGGNEPVFQQVWGKGANWHGCHKSFSNIPGGFGCGTKVGWTVMPTHLERVREDKPTADLWQNVGKIPFIIFGYYHAPVFVLDVQF